MSGQEEETNPAVQRALRAAYTAALSRIDGQGQSAQANATVWTAVHAALDMYVAAYEAHTAARSAPPRYRKRPVTVEAVRWFTNGDHPDDGVDEPDTDLATRETYTRVEGAVVRFYRHPQVNESALHSDSTATPHRDDCHYTMREHGWIDTAEGGHVVCPGDWIVTGVQGEHYPVKDAIFRQTYEPIEDGP